ncbi:flagellar basal body rod C-terminal domain-containing protein [Colwellia sp. MEBiC06753]
MAVHSIYEISLLGMSYEKARLEVATSNIAQANRIASSPDALANSQLVGVSNTFWDALQASQLSGVATNINVDKPEIKALYKPEHAGADDNGFVYKLDINVAEQMLKLNSATRAYEANVKAFNAYKSMSAKALEIGK